MIIIAILILASALAGAACSLTFRAWALIPIAPLTAVFALVVMRFHKFSFDDKTPIIAIVACVVVLQIGYIATRFLVQRQDVENDDDVGEESERLAGRLHELAPAPVASDLTQKSRISNSASRHARTTRPTSAHDDEAS